MGTLLALLLLLLSAGQLLAQAVTTNSNPPTAGTGISVSGTAVSQALTNATQTAVAVDPTAVASASGTVMAGLGVTTCRITPAYSGRLHFEIHGIASNTTANVNATIGLRYGSGAGPANGAAATGTTLGNTQTLNGNAANYRTGFTISGIATSLTPGTTYWYDLTQNASANTASVANITCTAFEF